MNVLLNNGINKKRHAAAAAAAVEGRQRRYCSYAGMIIQRIIIAAWCVFFYISIFCIESSSGATKHIAVTGVQQQTQGAVQQLHEIMQKQQKESSSAAITQTDIDQEEKQQKQQKALSQKQQQKEQQQKEDGNNNYYSYGLDCSFPVHHLDFSNCDNPGILGNRQALYDKLMEGCRKTFNTRSAAKICDAVEKDRIAMSVRQPQSLVNYTYTGYKKVRAPSKVRELLSEHWFRNKDNKKLELFQPGYTYLNFWESPTYMISVEDPNLRGTGAHHELKNAIWDATKDSIEQWTGMELRPTSLYGIRMYTQGAFMLPHVDRLPLVSSAIINVAQDVDEPWPLEVYDRKGKAVNITMEPGDMVLFESGSLIHGRPFPLQGRYYANIFIHFEPTGRLLNDYSDRGYDTGTDFLPPYLLPNSPEVDNWLKMFPDGWQKPTKIDGTISSNNNIMYDNIDKNDNNNNNMIAKPTAIIAAQRNDVGKLAELYFQNTHSKNTLYEYYDNDGFQPIHMAAKHGNKEALELLIQFGADMNALTTTNSSDSSSSSSSANDDAGGRSPLNIALSHLQEGEFHPVAQYLMGLGAANIGPDL